MVLARVCIGLGAIALAGCQTTSQPQADATGSETAREAHALAQAACGSCHAVEAHGLSPNPEAPEWPVIANRAGLTAETLGTWLRDAHNYPEQMDFYLEDDEVDALVEYMLSLREEGFEPPIQ